eukprot:CAMPEP_0118650010 /NCGR_PEP_ID=MMETSP0785-20121206/10017_1 /TAXON_ID=91992 /ORGANISM="Bolidomonas pacifica, Strain CCMP 1866" /LENGTH=68 /DNA_ID=CAMNT_0006542353 /DNA_START=377 /DNA_END=580 /DNA_ORIENTATION=-
MMLLTLKKAVGPGRTSSEVGVRVLVGEGGRGNGEDDSSSLSSWEKSFISTSPSPSSAPSLFSSSSSIP